MTQDGEDAVVLAARIREELAGLVDTMQRIGEAKDAMRDATHRELAVDSAALNLHAFYVSLERTFEAIARTIDESLPSSASWHRDLLQQMSLDLPGKRPPVVSHELLSALSQLLRFRHVVRNVYAHELDEESVVANIVRVERIHPFLSKSLESFADWLDSLESE